MIAPDNQVGLDLSVIIPAYNESSRICGTLPRVADFLNSRDQSFEIIVVDDGSTDDTAAVVEELRKKIPKMRLLKLPENRGKGMAVRVGMLDARGSRLLFSDADLATPIEELETLLPFLEDGYDVAIGSRALRRELIGVHQSPFRENAGKLFNVAMRAISGLDFRDTQCGFKLFTQESARAIFRQMTLSGFAFDVEALYLAKKFGFRTAEVAVRWNHVEDSRVRALRHGTGMLMDVFRIRRNDWSGRYSNVRAPLSPQAAS